jgi:hypothetical protein
MLVSAMNEKRHFFSMLQHGFADKNHFLFAIKLLVGDSQRVMLKKLYDITFYLFAET